MIPAVQQYSVNKITHIISKNWKNSRLEIKSITIKPNLKIKASDICIYDQKNNPMIYVGKLETRFHHFLFSNHKLSLGHSTVTNVQVKLIKYLNDTNVNIHYFAENFQNEKQGKGFILQISHINMQNSYFVFRDENQIKMNNTDSIIDYKNFEISNINIITDTFYLNRNDIRIDIKNLSMNQYTGFKIKQLQGLFRINPKGLSIKQLKLITENSNISANFCYKHNSFKSYSQFVNLVNFNTIFNTSILSLKDIAYFVPALKGMNNQLRISGTIKGPVSTIQCNDLSIDFKDNSHLKLNAKISGLPDLQKTFVNLELHDNNQLDIREINTLILPKNKNLNLPSNIVNLGIVKPSGKFSGKLTNFTTEIVLSTNIGFIQAFFKAQKKEDQLYHYNGSISTNHFNIGKLTNLSKDIGCISFSSQINGKGFTKNDLSLNLNGMVKSIVIENYPVSNITVKGNYKNRFFTGKILGRDTNFNFNFNGTINFTEAIPNTQFYLSVKQLNLSRIFKNALINSNTNKLLRKIAEYAISDTNICIKVDSMSAVLNGIKDEDISGLLFIDKLTHQKGDKYFEMNRLRLNVLNFSNFKKIRLISDNVDGIIITDYLLKDIPSKFKSFVADYIPAIITNNLKPSNSSKTRNTFINMEFKLKNTSSITQLMMPNLYIQEGGEIEVSISNRQEPRTLKIYIPKVQINSKMSLSNIHLNGYSLKNTYILNLNCDTVAIPNSDFTDINIDFQTGQNTVAYQSKFNLPSKFSSKTSSLNGKITFLSPTHIIGHMDSSLISILTNDWNFTPNHQFEITQDYIKFDHVSIFADYHKIDINGFLSKKEGHKVDVMLQEIDLNQLNPYLNKSNLNFNGTVNSQFSSYIQNSSRITAGHIYISDFIFNQQKFGNIFLESSLSKNGNLTISGSMFDSEQELSLEKKLNYKKSDLPSQNYRKADILGFYDPISHQTVFDFDIFNTGICFLEPFIQSFSHKVNGNADGKLKIVIAKDSSYFDGKINISNGKFGIRFLNTIYSINNQSVLFNKEGIVFPDILLTDSLNHIAKLKGSIQHNFFKNLKVDLQIDADNLLVLNTSKGYHESFYGTAFASGRVNIIGNTQQMNITGTSLRTEHNTKIYLPITFDSQASENSFIIYKKPFIEKNQKVSTIQPSSMILNSDLNIDVNPNAVIQIDLDPSIGGTLSASTQGNLRIIYNTLKDLQLIGNLTIDNGIFNLALKDLFTRKFTLNQGGFINFTGKVANANINLSAALKTSTSLTNILPNTTSGRLPVNSLIKLNGNLMKPNLDFNFELPNASNDIKTQFYAVIDTTNEQNKTKQFFSLMVMGCFDTQSSTTTDLVKEGVNYTATELLTSTINNFLARQSKYVEVGFNYRTADSYNPDQYSVLIHSSLLNNRLIIDGNVGFSSNNPSGTQTGTNNFIGDISLEYKLNQEGNWIFKIFNITNQYDVLNQTTPYSQGISIIYKKEFSSKKDYKQPVKKKKKP